MNFLFVMIKDSVVDLPLVLQEMGHSVTVMDQYAFDPIDLSATEPLSLIEQAVLTQNFDYAITYQYVPLLSDLFLKHHLTYIAWVYDSPLISLFHRSVFNDTNRIFIFDHTLYERMKKLEIPHIYYMPLAANTSRANRLALSIEDEKKYSCDISFVGGLYEKNAYNDIMHKVPPEITLPMNQYLMHQLCNWHEVRTWPLMPPECTAYLTNEDYSDTTAIHNFEMPDTLYLGILFLCRKLGEMERITALDTLAETHKVDLYTSSKSDQIGILNVHPPVNYYTELGKVYHFSKINLNFTLPSIETGVPLRIFDIMAFGGFVMSNYQAEYDTLFTPGRDLVVFHDLGELKELTDYYLNHEKERLTIAANGYKTVNKYYSYKHQLEQILAVCASGKEEA
ncbi:MAG: DUF3880 domain-containing protein [Lachnospiraceae bacterium]|nr:DUF3880 domain-containing protein [Lachnospiraceae bacterium]